VELAVECPCPVVLAVQLENLKLRLVDRSHHLYSCKLTSGKYA
jgi:hypothetical protein